jgi:predicted nucleic acid-binding protein
MNNAIFVDTWGWLTLNDAGQCRHRDVAQLYRTLIAEKSPIYTTTFVLDETFTLFFKRLNSFHAQRSRGKLSLFW